MNKIRKGDEVIVTTGKDKGRRGTVLDGQGHVVADGIRSIRAKDLAAQAQGCAVQFGKPGNRRFA